MSRARASRPRGPLLAALALVATFVVGSEDAREAAPAPAPAAAEPQLEVERLQRAKRSAPIVDVFTPKVVVAPVPVPVAAPVREAPPAPPAPPTAPALPFRYVGKFSEEGMLRLLIVNGEREHHIAGGETLDGVYRVDEISDEAVVFTYLPLKVRQTLAFPEEQR
jgi:hypothetical protein